MNVAEKDTALFASLVMMFHSATMQHLGKVKNPLSDKIERDLDQAQMTIDMLEMLDRKTKGNLNEDEAHYLGNVLRELRLNYVDERSKKSEEQPPKDEEQS
ncbi:MAG: DUF1844 domain-containing protein [Ignavibacteria bacterium]|nr:DUF1844 domain-containing protein [Ignavibacteria bacterium]